MTGRPRVITYLFLISVLIMVMYDPFWLTDVSWQLSVFATAALVFPIFDAGKLSYLFAKRVGGKEIFIFLENLSTSLQVAIWVLPIMIWHFGEATLISIISTPLVGWTIMPITIGGFILAFASDFLWSPILLIVSDSMEIILRLLIGISKMLSLVDLKIFINLSYPWIATYYFILIALILLISRNKD